MVFKVDEKTEFAFHVDRLSSLLSILLVITRKMVRKGIQRFLTYMQDVSVKVSKMEQVFGN